MVSSSLCKAPQKILSFLFGRGKVAAQDATNVARRTYIPPKMTVREVQPQRTQAYYDELARELSNGGAFYNSRTGVTYSLPALHEKNTFASYYSYGPGNRDIVRAPKELEYELYKGQVSLDVLQAHYTEFSDARKALDGAQIMYRSFADGTRQYRRPGSVFPFMTMGNTEKATKCKLNFYDINQYK